MEKEILLIEMWPNRIGKTIIDLIGKMHIPYKVKKPYSGECIPDEYYKGIIISPGEPNICELDKYPFLNNVISFTRHAISKNIPILGICLGHEILAYAAGGEVSRADGLKAGFIEISHNSNWIFNKIYNPLTVFQYHFNEVVRLPGCAEILAESEGCRIQAFKIKDKPCFGIQFHPEISLQKSIGILIKRKEFLELKRIDTTEAINLGQKKYNEDQAKAIIINYLDRAVLKNDSNVKIKAYG